MNATDVWLALIFELMSEGVRTTDAKRNEMNSGSTMELLSKQTIVDMHFPIVSCKARRLSRRFLYAEAWWILSGRDDVASISEYNKVMTKFSDDGQTFYGAYGPRIASQLWPILEKLLRDPETRQAVLTIWRPNPPESKDIPCTVSIQFLIRGGYLHCVDTMRSSDAWLGWPYDVFNFSMLSIYLLIMLEQAGKRYKLGKLFLTAGSQHLYERDWGKVLQCIEEGGESGQPINPHYWKTPEVFVHTLKNVADGKEQTIILH